MIKTDKIAILMATYNSMPYLVPQLDSVLAQDNQDWHLYIHDDGSQDETLSTIDDYVAKYPARITRLEYPSQGGARNNFMSMLERIDAPYYMFCDHDDVWHINKVRVSIETIKQLEKSHPNKPILAHCDAVVVDKDLQVIHPSYRKRGHLTPESVTCFEEFVYNISLGCAMIFNHQASESALSLSWKHATMHDGWLTARVFAEKGIVHTIPEALLDYRQTGNNTIGAIDGKKFTMWYRIKNFVPMIFENIEHYNMLKSAGYPSVFKYYYHKLKKHITL